MDLDAVDVLIEAKLWIDKGWCQAAFGRMEDGRLATKPATATSVCAIGAIVKASGSESWLPTAGAAWDAEILLQRALPNGTTVALFNDTSTKEEVQAAFDRAIALFNDTSTKEEVQAAFDRAIDLGLEALP